MKLLFLTLLSRLWNLTSPSWEPMGKNRAVKLMLAKAEREGFPDRSVRAEYFSYEGEL